jgi:hypothetical protein
LDLGQGIEAEIAADEEAEYRSGLGYYEGGQSAHDDSDDIQEVSQNDDVSKVPFDELS